MLLGVDIPLVGTPSIGIEARDTKRLQQGLQVQKDPILALSKDISQHSPTVMINRVPQPPLVRFLADITPHPRANSAEGRRPSTGPEKRSAPRAGQRLGGVVARRWRPPARSLRGRDRRY